MTAVQPADLPELAFVARLVHELAAPVGGLAALLDGNASTLEAADRDLASSNLALLRSMLHQAQQYLQGRHLDLCCSPLPLLPLCRTAINTVALRAEQIGIWIVLDVQLEEPVVWGEETAIVRVLDNLLANALGVTPAVGVIIVQVTAPDPAAVEIAIIDQGPVFHWSARRVCSDLSRYRPRRCALRPPGPAWAWAWRSWPNWCRCWAGPTGCRVRKARARFYVQLAAVAPLRTDPEVVAQVLHELFMGEVGAGLAEQPSGGVA